MGFEASRRDFIAGVGGLVAVSSLPSFADDPSHFPLRGNYERLSLVYRHVKAGAEKPFSILHISDTHLTAAYPDEPYAADKLRNAERRSKTFGGRQEEALRDSLAWAKKNVDFVLHTGDLIDWQSKANFDLVRKYCGETMLGSVGNHEFYSYLPDEKRTLEESFKERSWSLLAGVYPYDARFGARTVNGVNFICINDVFGTVQPDIVEKFRMEAKKGLPIVLCMHVPLYTDEIWRAASKFWRSNGRFTSAAIPEPFRDCKLQRSDPVTAGFVEYLKKEPLLKAILAGHAHITVQDDFSPTAVEYVVGGNFMFHGEEIFFT